MFSAGSRQGKPVLAVGYALSEIVRSAQQDKEGRRRQGGSHLAARFRGDPGVRL
jgi:hypothetical protein